jgi:hypothetical protein
VLHVIPLAGQPAIQTVQVNGRAAQWSRSADGGLMVTLEK